MKYFNLLCLLLIVNFCSAQRPSVVAFTGLNGERWIDRGIIDANNNYVFCYGYDASGVRKGGIAFFSANFQKHWAIADIVDTSGGVQLKQAPDGDYVALFSLNGGDNHLIKFDSNGIILFHNTFHRSTAPLSYVDFDFDIQGNIYISGVSSALNGGLILTKLDNNGMHIFTERYLNTIPKANLAGQIHVKGGNLFLMTSYKRSNAQATDFLRVIINADLSGNIKWAREISNPSQSINFDITNAPNGGLLLFGSIISDTLYNPDAEDGLLVRLDSNGDVLSRMRYGDAWNDNITGAVLTNAGDFKVIGHTTRLNNSGKNLLVMSVSNNLVLNYHKYYGTNTANGGFGSGYYNLGKDVDGYYSYGRSTLFKHFSGLGSQCLRFDTAMNLSCKFYNDTLAHRPANVYSIPVTYTKQPYPYSISNSNSSQLDTLQYAIVCSGFPTTSNILEKSAVQLDIVPNPNSGSFYLQTEGNIEQITIYSVNGQQVKTVENYRANTRITLELKGLFILDINFKNGHRTTRKLLVE